MNDQIKEIERQVDWLIAEYKKEKEKAPYTRELEACFSDLYALVQGECPSILEDYFMDVRYAAIMEKIKKSRGAA